MMSAFLSVAMLYRYCGHQFYSVGDASLRYVITLDTQPAPELHRNPSFVRLTFPSDEQSKPHYQVVFDGKDERREQMLM